MKPLIWVYSQNFPPCLCYFWAIKILPNQPIRKLTFFVGKCLSCPPALLDNISRIFIIFYISLYFFLILVKCSNYLPYWNIEKGSIIRCQTPTSKICINAWKISESKLTYLWQQVHPTVPCIYPVTTKRKPKLDLSILNITPSPSPLSTNRIHYLISKTLQKKPD